MVLRDVSTPGILEALDLQGVETTRMWVGFQGGNVHEQPDMLRFVSGEPLFFANGVVGTRIAEEDIDRRIDDTVAFFHGFGVPWGWVVSPLSLPMDLEGRLLARGFHLEEEIPRMAREIGAMTDPSAPPGVAIQRVDDSATERAWLEVMARGFGQDEARRRWLAKVGAGAGLDRTSPWLRFVAFRGPDPVASSGLILCGGLAGIANVTTVPEARGRGIGTAMTEVPMNHARDVGYRVAVLGASEMGLSLYQRMGFVKVGWTRTYVRSLRAQSTS
jgi:GNAT superfamily N-acetyltransferase